MSNLAALWELIPPAPVDEVRMWRVVLVQPHKQRTIRVKAAGPLDAMRKAREKAPAGAWLVQTCQPVNQEVKW